MKRYVSAMPALQVAHQVQHLRLHRDVERGGRLVADQEPRLRRQRAGDRDPLPLAARELVRILRAVGGGEPDLREQRRDAVRDLGPTDAGLARTDRLGDDVVDGPARIQARVRVLEDHLHAAARRALRRAACGCTPSPASTTPSNAIGPARRRVQADDEPRDRRLAAAGLADEPERLAASRWTTSRRRRR